MNHNGKATRRDSITEHNWDSSVERATPGEEIPGLIPVVAACSLLVGSVSVQ